jgi:hypothetical protein
MSIESISTTTTIILSPRSDLDLRLLLCELPRRFLPCGCREQPCSAARGIPVQSPGERPHDLALGRNCRPPVTPPTIASTLSMSGGGSHYERPGPSRPVSSHNGGGFLSDARCSGLPSEVERRNMSRITDLPNATIYVHVHMIDCHADMNRAFLHVGPCVGVSFWLLAAIEDSVVCCA